MTIKLTKRISMIIIVILAILVGTIAASFTSRDRQLIFSKLDSYEHNGMTRKYRVLMPKNINENTKLIVGLHGFSDNSMRFAYYTGLHNVDSDAVYLYPEASAPNSDNIKKGWNAEFCCGSGWVNKIDDADFILQLTNKIADLNEIPPERTFITGFSNGGMMTQKMVNDHPERFAGFAVMAGVIGTQDAQLDISVDKPGLFIHGAQDTTLPIDGGGNDPEFQWLSFDTMLESWSKANACEARNQTDQNQSTTITFDGCNLSARVFEQDTHQWHDWRLFNFWNKRPEGSKLVIGFFDSLTK